MNTKSTLKPSNWFWKSWLAGSLLFFGNARADSLGVTALKIRAVVIDRQNIFSKEQENFWLFRLANRLHIRTREAVIRRELLFKEGEPYGSERAEETERNLRSVGVFGSVSITSHIVSDSLVDVLVETVDQWTTEGSLAFGGGGGAYKFSLGVEEKNLFGRAQKLELAYEESDLRVGRRATFYDRKFASAPLSLSLAAEDRSDGYYYSIETGKPLYSSREKWGGNLRFLSFSDRLRFFEAGEELFSFYWTSREAEFSALRSWGNAFKSDISLGYLITQNRLEGQKDNIDFARNQYGYVLPAERVHAVVATLTWYVNKFLKDAHLDNFGNVEDIRNGENVNLEARLAPEVLGSSLTRYELALAAGTTHQSGRHLMRLSAGNRTSFLSNGWEGTFWQGGGRWYWRWRPRLTAACRLDAATITGVSRYGQFLLGGESGLRGYEARSFSGSRMVLGSLEQRFFGPNFLSLLGIGGVLFVDFGNAWKAGEQLRLNEIKSNWGVGLRLGLLRSSQFRVLRFDWARPFGPGEWVFSFGAGMSFNFE